jgi:hypothetical protein
MNVHVAEWLQIYKRFEGNFLVSYLITFSSDYYSSMKDYETLDAFYKEKDTSKYKLALAQALDGIRARAEYVKVILLNMFLTDSTDRLCSAPRKILPSGLTVESRQAYIST